MQLQTPLNQTNTATTPVVNAPDTTGLTPDVFKQKVMAAHPEYSNAVASDGTPYSKMDSTDFTQRMAQRFPDAVTKDGHKYSDFLPKSPVAEQPKQGFWGKLGSGALNVLNTIEKPFIGLAATPVQLLAKALGKEDPYAKGMPGLAGSNIPVTDLNLEKKVGDLAQVGSYFVPGEGLLGAAGMGALQGGGSAMSEGGDLAKVATQTGIGGLVGGALGGATKLAGTGLQKLGESISGEGVNKAVQGIKDAYSKALNLNAGERAFEGRSGKDLADVLMKNEAPLNRYENGTLDASGAIEKLQTALDPLNTQADQLLNHSQGVVKNISLEDTFNSVKQRIQGLTISQAEKNAAIKHARELFDAEAGQYGTEVTPAVADKIKQGMWGSSFKGKLTSVDKLQGNVSYLTGNALKDATEKAVAGTDTELSLKAINQQRSDLVDAIKRLTNLDGVRILKGGKLGNMAGGLTGSIIGGASGGTGGALAGDYFGSKTAEFFNNPATRIAIAKGKAKMSGLLPNLLGESSQPVGNAITKTGNVVKKSARGVGLLGNLLTK